MVAAFLLLVPHLHHGVLSTLSGGTLGLARRAAFGLVDVLRVAVVVFDVSLGYFVHEFLAVLVQVSVQLLVVSNELCLVGE